MSHPRLLPDLFLDRSLGRVRVPKILRAADLRLVTLAEHYGTPQDQDIEDVRWIGDATASGWICLLKDQRVHRNQIERRAVRDLGARCFCLDNQNLTAAEMAGRYLAAIREITDACSDCGPFMYAVRRGKIEFLPLDD